MSLRSLFSALREKWSGRVAPRRRTPPLRRTRPVLEALEERVTPAVPPKIMSFMPSNGSTVGSTSANPTLSITFSEAMDPVDVQNTANYYLFNSEGQQIPVNTATYTASNYTVTLSYNGNAVLPADTYSLFIRGDTIHNQGDAFTLANPGQIVAANTATSTVSTLNTSIDPVATQVPPPSPTTSLFNSLQSYPVTAPNGSALTATPVGVAVADFNGDGFKDVAVVNAGTDELDIYDGTASGVYSFSPTLRIALPAGQDPVGLLSADFRLNGQQDLAVLDHNGNVDVYLNTSAANALSFAPVATYAVGVAPTSFAVGDLDGNGTRDIIVADPTPVSNGAAPPVFNYFAYYLSGTGAGTFAAAAAIQVGTVGVAGSLQFPSLIAAGNLGLAVPAGDTVLARGNSFVLGGSNGVQSWINQGQDTFAYTPTGIFGPTGPTALAVGQINQGGGGFGGQTEDVLAAFRTMVGNVTTLHVYTPNGTNEVTVPLSVGEVVNNIITANVNGDAKQDILFSTQNGPNVGTQGSDVGVLINTSTAGGGGGPGTVSLAAEVDYGVDTDPVGDVINNSVNPPADTFANGLAFGGTDGDHNPYIITANSHINTQNQTISSFSVLRGTVFPATDGTFIQAPALTDPSGKGTTSIAVGDVNGDGIPDLVVSDEQTNTISVYLGQGNGTYGAAENFSTLDAGGNGEGPVSVVLADLNGALAANGDPILDVITANSGDNTVSVLMGNGDGTFQTAVTYKVGVSPTQVVAANFNPDAPGGGHIDLAVAHDGAGAEANARGITLLMGNGDGTFQPGTEILSNVDATALVAADFFVDSTNSLDLVVADAANGEVDLLRNDGLGDFSMVGAYQTAPDVTALAAGDLLGNGFQDVVAVSGSSSTADQVTTLLNNAGSGFRPAVFTTLPLDAPVNSVALTTLNPANVSPYLDLVVGTVGGLNSQGVPIVDNVFTMQANGDGTFQNPIPYEAGGEPSPTFVAIASDPLIHVTSFYKGGQFVAPNLIANGNFESVDLSNERGNLDGWQTASITNSWGGWYTQTGTQSPLSQTTVPALTPVGLNKYQAMLDQSNLIPLPPNVAGVSQANPNNTNLGTSTYEGSNFLYQTFTIPSSFSAATGTLELSMQLYINTTQGVIGFTNPNANPSLDYRTYIQGLNDYQVRVDILAGTDTNIEDTTTGAGHVLDTIFQSSPNTVLTNGVLDETLTANLTSVLGSLAGQQVILRISGVTNRGLLIVGADNVMVTATYTDTTVPSDTGPQLRNLGFQTTPNGPPVTTDPTVIGTVNQSLVGAGGNGDGGVNNIAYIEFDTTPGTDPNFTGPNVFKTAFIDGDGNFQLTLPDLSYGLNTLGVRVVDKAGNSTSSTFTFIYQGPSTSEWQSVGPGPINVASVGGLQYSSVTGTVTATATDPSDPSGNTYIVGAEDGGLWKTTDGGNSWTPLIDNLTDANGNPITEAIGAVAYDQEDPKLVYAATGDGNLLQGTQPGDGVLLSTNGGASWTISANSETVLAGARVTAMVTSNPTTVVNNQTVFEHYVWVAVAAGGAFGPGVYRSTDGGQTWNIVMGVANMQGLAAGTTGIASATSIIVDPADSADVIVGLGNIGLTTDATAPATAGVWQTEGTANGNVVSWSRMVGGLLPGVPNSTLPSGAGLGRVTVAEGLNVTTNIATYYVLIGTPPNSPPETGGSVNFGGFPPPPSVAGLYKTKDGGDSFTKVLLAQETAAGTYTPIDLLAADAGNVGALAVDPTDPNVVYVGGSIQNYTATNNPLAHGLIRVDTGDMRDTSYTDPNTGTIPNDGDDIQTVAFDEANGIGDEAEGVSWYDLAENAVDPGAGANLGDFLPAEVTSLSVDAQGRLIIGTEEGVWRAVYHGVGYDYSGGGDGTLKTATPTPQVSITTINGNLQISQLTSVAVDPQNSGRFYTTEYQTGSAVTNGGLNWNTSGLTGPANVNGGPDGDAVLVAPPDPTAPAGTLSTEYLLYAFNDQAAGAATNFQPLQSQDAGTFGSYVDLPTAGLPPLAVGEKAGYLPVFNIYAQTIFDSGKFENELLLGTDKIYTTRTGSALWDDISPILSPGAYIVAATFAQNTDQTIYAATSDGKLWVTTNGGGSWNQEDTGLPTGGTITSIQADATNSQEAFVTVNGGTGVTGHVFMTTNGGASWTNISVNLPVSAAYSLAENPQIQPVDAAPNGRLYVGTSSGVYISTNFTSGIGTTWTQLGVGLPNVAVTSLNFNQGLEELVAGTDGRGGFVISTNFVGPHVVSVSPATLVNPLTAPLTSVTVTFNEPISSFPASQVSIVGAGGETIPVLSVKNVSVTLPGQSNPATQWKITFAPQSANGVYTFSVGPDVLDIVGNAMDQNGNEINGENPGDIYTFNVVLNSTDDGNFVTGIYSNILGRPSDTVGFENLLTLIDGARNGLMPGLADAYVVQLGAAQLVNDLYQSSGVTDSTTNVMSVLGVGDLLGRPANGTEQAYWAGVLANGGSFEQMIASIVADPSYFAQNSASQPINGNDVNFVTQVYKDLMNRAPTPLELFGDGVPGDFPGFVPQLQTAEAAARTADARNLLAGTSYQADVIGADYNTYLNRNPAAGPTGDIAYWLNEFRAGVTQDQFVASLVSSPEYYFNDAPRLVGAGASIDTWVRAVYQQFFPGYTISGAELSYWDNLLGSNQMTLYEAAGILDTTSLYHFGNLSADPSNPGALNGSVDVAYRTLLGRDATPQEIAYWEEVYAANPGYRIEDLDAAILGSAEFFTDNTTGNTPESAQNQHWADALYTDILGSTNESAEQTTDLPFVTVQEENARLAVSTAVVNSQEFHTKVIDFVYENYLNRPPSSYEVNNVWLPVVGQGGAPGGLNGDEQLLAAVLGSPEYFNRQSDPTDAGLATDNSWLTSLYTSLRVPVNQQGEQANLNYMIGAYAPTRLAAVEILLNSPEYLGNFVTTEYNALLGRAPSAGEVGFWIGAMQAGTTQEQLIASLISSPEFFNRAPNILGLGATPASNTTLVEAAYKVLFPGYTITASDLNTWLPQLGAGYNAAAALNMAAGLDTSSLYYFGVNGLINRTYVALLGRTAQPFEISYWMANYTTTQNLIAAITDSEEYFLKTKTFP